MEKSLKSACYGLLSILRKIDLLTSFECSRSILYVIKGIQLSAVLTKRQHNLCDTVGPLKGKIF